MAKKSLLCAIGLHAPGTDQTVNGKMSFARCRRCEVQVVRRDRGFWKALPRNMRVVWRKADAGEMTWPTQIR